MSSIEPRLAFLATAARWDADGRGQVGNPIAEQLAAGRGL
jgi:hypothetical protein